MEVGRTGTVLRDLWARLNPASFTGSAHRLPPAPGPDARPSWRPHREAAYRRLLGWGNKRREDASDRHNREKQELLHQNRFIGGPHGLLKQKTAPCAFQRRGGSHIRMGSSTASHRVISHLLGRGLPVDHLCRNAKKPARGGRPCPHTIPPRAALQHLVLFLAHHPRS